MRLQFPDTIFKLKLIFQFYRLFQFQKSYLYSDWWGCDGFTIWQIIANIFMLEFENVLVPKVSVHVKNWRRFVDDTFVCIKCGSIENVLSVLNLFLDNIKFTYEQENWLPFLDVLFIRDYEKINSTVFRKDTRNGFSSHWKLFSPIIWKRGTSKSLISRAYMIAFNQSLLEK